MKLTFLYQPVKDLKESVAFYRDTLGLDEAWREGDMTVAFALPGTEVAVMLDVPNGENWGPGGFYEVESVEKFVADHPGVTLAGEVFPIPGGHGARFLDPSGNVLYLLDQSTDEVG